MLAEQGESLTKKMNLSILFKLEKGISPGELRQSILLSRD